ncbi:SDR family NAD(P)-dependent oxidoreductase [Acinetobacter sp.]|uniref:SDR family NAD(P)-dependent oxidoreductase n=1 Tax=Acinetobacter sp. TaxID=472 RepID=UPI0031D08763
MILITGGLGFVGSHIALRLLQRGHGVVLVDNLVNSHSMNLERLQQISGQYIPFSQVDLRNTPALNKFIEQYPIDAVIHCAGFKSLQESTIKPIEYYNNNLNVLMSLIRVMQRIGCHSLIHLSSAVVYGQSALNLHEETELNHHYLNPYAHSQQMMEQILQDVSLSDEEWNIVLLRVSNVVGAFEQGLWGEYIPKLPKSIMGLLMQIAHHEREYLELYQQAGTEDKTVERNFVHVLDVCQAVEKALYWQYQRSSGYDIFNIASQEHTSIAKLIQKVEQVTKTKIPTIEPHFLFRPLDQISLVVEKAQRILNWTAERSLGQMIEDQWLFYNNVNDNYLL